MKVYLLFLVYTMFEYARECLALNGVIPKFSKEFDLDLSTFDLTIQELPELTEILRKIHYVDDEAADNLITINGRFIPLTSEQIYEKCPNLFVLSALCSIETFKFFIMDATLKPSDIAAFKTPLYECAALGGNWEVFHILEQIAPMDLYVICEDLSRYYILEQFLIMALPQYRNVIEPAVNALRDIITYCNMHSVNADKYDIFSTEIFNDNVRTSSLFAMYASMSKQNFTKIASYQTAFKHRVVHDLLPILSLFDCSWLTKNDLHDMYMQTIKVALSINYARVTRVLYRFITVNRTYEWYDGFMTKFINKFTLTESDLEWFLDQLEDRFTDYGHCFNFTYFTRYCHDHNYKQLVESESFKRLSKRPIGPFPFRM